MIGYWWGADRRLVTVKYLYQDIDVYNHASIYC
jgi:hypothetical protein